MSSTEFITTVSNYVEAVINNCTVSENSNPMLTDGLNLQTGKPFRWENHILSNLACQQNFLRTLDGLGTLTSDPKYHVTADEWISYALKKLQDPASDLLFWGGHTSYDLLTNRPILGNHEMKCVYPHYDYLYRVDPNVTTKFIEAFWHAHIWDWSTLLFNRHGEYRSLENKGRTEFKNSPLPIIENTALSFINTGSDLILASAQINNLSGNEWSLPWTYNLLSRYDQIRHPETNLAGYQFNHRDPCRVRTSFKPPLNTRQDLSEVTVLTNNVIKTRYGRAAITFLNLVQALGPEKGEPFKNFVIADLEALAEHAYEPGEGCFYPVLNDGTRLTPENAQENMGYCSPSKLEKVPANGLMFLSYARAYNLTGIERFKKVSESLATAMGWGSLEEPRGFNEVGSPPDEHGWVNSGQNDACALFGLLELHEATGNDLILNVAASLGQQLMYRYQMNDFITSDKDNYLTNIDTALPLALLHVTAAKLGQRNKLPLFFPNNTYFDPKIVIHRRKEKQ